MPLSQPASWSLPRQSPVRNPLSSPSRAGTRVPGGPRPPPPHPAPNRPFRCPRRVYSKPEPCLGDAVVALQNGHCQGLGPVLRLCPPRAPSPARPAGRPRGWASPGGPAVLRKATPTHTGVPGRPGFPPTDTSFPQPIPPSRGGFAPGGARDPTPDARGKGRPTEDGGCSRGQGAVSTRERDDTLGHHPPDSQPVTRSPHLCAPVCKPSRGSSHARGSLGVPPASLALSGRSQERTFQGQGRASRGCDRPLPLTGRSEVMTSGSSPPRTLDT
ncbi:proline-rich protein 2-like [Mustela putorius furo]|uniref:Proline-rich protein 2-like n=1 Tax=Mustela putorius furo TaxID=9669 RepID=A0A8U0NPS6_MUSPF|nr:proline-rich protein 2-like [Mustela putorius furo]